MPRISAAHVDAKLSILNSILGFEVVKWNTVGALSLRGENGHYALYWIKTESAGVDSLYRGTLRECSTYIEGMIQMHRMIKEKV